MRYTEPMIRHFTGLTLGPTDFDPNSVIAIERVKDNNVRL